MPMVVNELPNDTWVRLVQKLKASELICVTEFGKAMASRWVQLAKADEPMVVTALPRVTDCRL